LKTGSYAIQLYNSPTFGNTFLLPSNQPFDFKMAGVSNSSIKIQTNGNVGINTALNPTDYKLAVGGKIIAEELKVQLQAQWPDYVFAKNYKLPTLAEVEKQIQEKGHLANMPSATDVRENGFEVGEMSCIQQEKIEELTLYIIKLNQQLEAQEKRMQALEAKVKN
jgi:fructose-specific phosphotransferase system component IIB